MWPEIRSENGWRPPLFSDKRNAEWIFLSEIMGTFSDSEFESMRSNPSEAAPLNPGIALSPGIRDRIPGGSPAQPVAATACFVEPKKSGPGMLPEPAVAVQ
jgi:hypothetical protein